MVRASSHFVCFSPPKTFPSLLNKSTSCWPPHLASNNSAMSKQEIIHAYRNLYRAALKAVCYSQPASTTLRTILRQSFRAKDANYNERSIRRTIWFLNNAARETGIEHKIVKNILITKFWKDSNKRSNRASWKQVLEGVKQKEYAPSIYPARPLSNVCY